MLGKLTKKLKSQKKEKPGSPGAEAAPAEAATITPQPQAPPPLPGLTMPPPPDPSAVGLPVATEPVATEPAQGGDAPAAAQDDDLMSLFADEDHLDEDLQQLSNSLGEVDIRILSDHCQVIEAMLRGLVARSSSE